MRDYTDFEHQMEVPEEARLLCIRPYHDGRWCVSLIDPRGVGHEAISTGWGQTPLDASRSAVPGVLAAIETRRTRDAANQERWAHEDAAKIALRDSLYRSHSGRRPAPDPTAPPAPRPSPARSQGSAARPSAAFTPPAARSAGSVTGWDDSVPRQAAEWHVAADRSVTVLLWPGLVFATDAPGQGPRSDSVRRFATVRHAKDWTRAAIPAPPPRPQPEEWPSTPLQRRMQAEGEMEEAARATQREMDL